MEIQIQIEHKLRPCVGMRKENEMKSITDTLLVSINLATNDDIAVLIVGRKRPNQSVEIINAFQGEDATDLYKLLTTVKKGE